MYARGEKPGGEKGRAVAAGIGRREDDRSEVAFVDNRGLSHVTNGQILDRTREQATDNMAKAPLMRRAMHFDESNLLDVDNRSYDTSLTQLKSALRSKNDSISNTINVAIQLKNGKVEGLKTRRRRGAITEHDLKPEEKEYLRRLRDVVSILKFNFAGSGEEVWKTHKPGRKRFLRPDKKRYLKPGKEPMKNAVHQSGGKKYSKKQIWKSKLVFEYAGPISGLIKGAKDSGSNSTKENLKDAKREFKKFMRKYREAGRPIGWKLKEMPKVQIKIKGFSRGAATASVFADWIKKHPKFKGAVDVNLVLIDPVHGSGPIGKGWMPSKQDVSRVYDKDSPGSTGTTYLMPIKSGHATGNAFTPQRLSGYQRLIIAYGKKAEHSFGLGEQKGSWLIYEGKKIKGMQLSTLPPGLFVVDSANMNIVRVPSMDVWNKNYRKKILRKADRWEGRRKIIEKSLEHFFP